MILVIMATALNQEEYFAIRYFNAHLWRKKKQNFTLKKGHFKPLNRIFLPKKMFMVTMTTAQLNYNGNEPLVHVYDFFT